MKVVLINPPITRELEFADWDLTGLDTYCPPLGLLYIASYIRQRNHTPYVIDAIPLKWSLRKLVSSVLSLQPDVVGISSTTVNIFNANRIAKGLREGGLQAPIIIGGPHISAVPVETLEKFKSFDFGVVGEGEVTFLELIERLESKDPARDVQNVIWRREDGAILKNPSRPMIEDLDGLPLPAWDLLPNFPNAYPHNPLEVKHLPAATILASRGCPFHCTFCDRAVYGNLVRHHSAEYTLEMIEYLRSRYGIRDLMIVDDNFLLNKEKLFSVCESLLSRKLDISWYCLAHIRYMTEERLKMIKRAGCWIMEVGIESGSERILKFIKKNNTKTEIAAAIKRANDLGIKIKGNFIFGLPTETQESLEETIQFATSIDLHLFQQTYMTILPGCEIASNAKKYGEYESDWSKITMFRVNFIPHGLTREDLVEASKKAFRRFYLRPKVILRFMVQSFASFRAMKGLMISFIAFLKTIMRKAM